MKKDTHYKWPRKADPTKKLIKELRKALRKDFGPPCKEFFPTCVVCQVWHAYDILKKVISLT